MVRIYVDLKQDGRRVRRFAAPTREGFYRCFPPGANDVYDARLFRSLEEVAAWLDAHPGWGVRMAAPGETSAMIHFRGIIIEWAA